MKIEIETMKKQEQVYIQEKVRLEERLIGMQEENIKLKHEVGVYKKEIEKMHKEITELRQLVKSLP